MLKKYKNLSNYARTSISTYGIILLAFVILFPLQQAGALSYSFSGMLVPICAYIVMAISLNLTVGVLGELSLGHAGFMSIGAFSGAIAAVSLGNGTPDVLRLVLGVLIGGVLAGISGLLIGIPVLRLKGDYLAIVTLAFGEIIKNIVNCLYVGVDAAGLHFSMTDVASLHMTNGTVILKGPQGAVGIPKVASFLSGIILILITLFVVINLVHSRTGRAIKAIRNNQIAAESVGISITKYKMIAFITSAALAGMAGAMYAMNYSSIVAKKFDFNTSILILVFVVLGGMGKFFGTIVATTVLYMLPEIFREFGEYRMLIYAVVLIVVMLATNSSGAKMLKDKIVDFVKNLFARSKNKKVEAGGADSE
ncbi:MAG: branched-chain amino acid ABC transporter permease [Oscillospiraceae bacterium]|nr:branched-chain amino acid ABC transporter permease [Oscillospiraceae bacterium]